MPGSGKVSRYYTAWCGSCDYHEDHAHSRSVAEVERTMRREGWRKRKPADKWVCPNCVARGRRG